MEIIVIFVTVSGSTIKKLLQSPLMKRLPAWIQRVFDLWRFGKTLKITKEFIK